MPIGVPREAKAGERRVGLDVAAVAALCADGFALRVETGAGLGIDAPDDEYRAAGATVVARDEAWACDLVVKVKEIQEGEWERLRAGTTLFSFQHLVGEPELARRVAASGITAIAYELVRDARGDYPMLAAMSAIAGRLAVQAGTQHGPRIERVLILGAGHAGCAAARAALEGGARVAMLCRSQATRERVSLEFGRTIEAAIATPADVERHALGADLVVGAVFVPGAPTPKLISRALVARMKRGAVIVDVSIDAGGVAETSRPTTLARPTFVEEGVVHYCVPNMPAAVPREASAALSAAALPYVRELASKGTRRAVRENAALRAGVLLREGCACHEGIAREAGLAYTPLTT